MAQFCICKELWSNTDNYGFSFFKVQDSKGRCCLEVSHPLSPISCLFRSRSAVSDFFLRLVLAEWADNKRASDSFFLHSNCYVSLPTSVKRCLAFTVTWHVVSFTLLHSVCVRAAHRGETNADSNWAEIFIFFFKSDLKKKQKTLTIWIYAYTYWLVTFYFTWLCNQ